VTHSFLYVLLNHFQNQVEENVAAAVELSTGGIDEQTLSEVEAILKPVKNQTWPSGIQQS
jgi:L-galactose dehydrogenase